MTDLRDIHTFYFIGIGGIGMSALARYCKLNGAYVYGYDKTATDLTEELIAEGIQILFEDNPELLPADLQDKAGVMVIYTPAIPQTNRILGHFQNKEYEIHKRAVLLGAITNRTKCLAVAGTHGKTTTSAILGHLLAESDMSVTAFLGGISENYRSNFISKGMEITVVEADEFDRSFLHLHPDIACVTSMDPDHLDIYGDAAQLQDSFVEFTNRVRDPRQLIIREGLPLKGRTAGIEDSSDYSAKNVHIKDGSYHFDLQTPNEYIPNLVFHLPGHHNLHNAVIALGMAILSGTPTPRLPKALSSFKGVERRFTYKIRGENNVLIDDYAHHPTEIDALYQAVDEMYPEEKKAIVFQPHLYSRTRDFATGFAKSLARFDEILLLNIYPARERPIEGINSEWLLEQIPNSNKKLIEKHEIANILKASDCKIKLLVGAGDIGMEVEKITYALSDES